LKWKRIIYMFYSWLIVQNNWSHAIIPLPPQITTTNTSCTTKSICIDIMFSHGMILTTHKDHIFHHTSHGPIMHLHHCHSQAWYKHPYKNKHLYQIFDNCDDLDAHMEIFNTIATTNIVGSMLEHKTNLAPPYEYLMLKGS